MSNITVHLTKVSTNVKTGPMPVSTTSKNSCPNSCSLKENGCYAASGPLGIHWAAVSNGKRGTDWETFCNEIKKLPKGIIWRHNQAGDLPMLCSNLIDGNAVGELVRANKGRKGFTYTHYPMDTKHNRLIVEEANMCGFTINLSADSYEEADKLASIGIAPVATLQAEWMPHTTYTPEGRKVITCPATYREDVSCYTCKLCQKQDRPIIAFPVHGTGKKKAQKVFEIKSVK